MVDNWKLKINPETKLPVFDDENRVVYIDPEGKELSLNPPAMYIKISDLGKENQKHRSKIEALRKKLEVFDGIEDLNEYKIQADQALKTLENFNDKDYLKADKVEKLKAEITSAYEEKIKNLNFSFSEKEKASALEFQRKEEQIRRLLISSKFAASQYFSGGGEKSKTILPSNIAEDHFGKYFKVEEGPDGLPTTKAYYANGDPVISRINPGDPADFEEAIGLILDKYPGKENILRSSAGGSGGEGGSGNFAGNDDLSRLRRDYTEATKSGNGALAIALKNKIYNLERATQ